ncbi:MAG TPA: oligoribonuclease [Candidatus Saccharimonadales bacterium]|nr:oligoribonuclease [Candidatus Saccharimonadales bacterium]
MSDIDKKLVPTKLLWIDLEMTGLDAQQDVILEVAAEVTDFDLKTLASYEARIRQPRETVLDRMQKNVWWADYPENRDEFVNRLDQGKLSREVEQDLIALVEEHFGREPAVLAGNSIHNDRKFITEWWPALDLKLHYRMLDVSSWKVFMQGRFGIAYDKHEAHRALEDIQESIAELQYYLDWFDKNQD